MEWKKMRRGWVKMRWRKEKVEEEYEIHLLVFILPSG